MKIGKAKKTARVPAESAAPNRLLNRRKLLQSALFSAGLAAVNVGIADADDTVGTNAPPWMKTPGKPFSGYGVPAKSQEKVKRIFTAVPGRAGTGSSRTPPPTGDRCGSPPSARS